jgi:hypothetical protein
MPRSAGKGKCHAEKVMTRQVGHCTRQVGHLTHRVGHMKR